MNDPDTQHLDSQYENIWTVYRIDDNGNTFVVRERLTRDEANRLVAEFEARGHKQMYWAEEKRM
ncbi:MAG TPA: hypothetical protein VG122_25360 [Gemmata sp.]|jgi:hypothetical protein|nr:hypothetical protein [Gemmata sp.]